MARKCENWLDTFLEWTADRSESPLSMLQFSALFTIAACVRRRVFLPEGWLGPWSCPPSLYMLFVADAGIAKKSTTLGFSEKLLDRLEILKKCPAACTTPDLLKRISEAPDNAVYITSSEFGNLITKAGPSIYDTLIELYDGKKKIDESTLSRGYVFANNPCLNFGACTTPDWVSANMPAAILNGGMGSRLLIIHEKEPRQKILMYHRVMARKNYRQIEDDLVHDLEEIMLLDGEFKLENPELGDWCNEWYENFTRELPAEIKRLKGYINRKPAALLKIAMIRRICYSNDLTITKDDLEWSLRMLSSIEPGMINVFDVIGKNTYVLSAGQIKDYIKARKRVRRFELLRAFKAEAEPYKLDELIVGLMRALYIKEIPSSDESGIEYEFLSDD